MANGDDKRKRRQFTAEQKAAALIRLIKDREAVSLVCADLDIAPNLLYRWQEEFWANASAAFAGKTPGPKPKSRESELAEQVQALEARIAHKDEVIAEVAEECVKLKKTLGRT